MADVVLPWELQIEILSWLPVKTLLQLRCVCKSWKSLISNSKAFTKLHLKRSQENQHVFLLLDITPQNQDGFFPLPVSRVLKAAPGLSMINDDWFCRVKSKNFSMINDRTCCRRKPIYSVIDDDYFCARVNCNTSIYDTCNGLLCLCTFAESRPIEKVTIRLWNPATRVMSRKSPRCAFRIYDSQSSFGFGYDDSRDTYKAVIMNWDYQERTIQTVVYCMGDTCWRKILSNPPFPLLLSHANGKFVGGSLNWLGFDKLYYKYITWDAVKVTLRECVIFSFDMREETYRFLSLPEGISQDVSHVLSHLGIMRNCLCLFHDHNKTHFVVWQMREYGVQESWTQMVRVSYEHLQFDRYPYFGCCMYFCENRDILLFMNFTEPAYHHGLRLHMYNLRDNSVKCVTRLDNNTLWLSRDYYVPSLVSPYKD